jgi:ABC-type phosphonate transport system ATPase subunit
MSSLLQTTQLTKIYGSGDTTVVALEQVSINIEPNEFVAIMGAERLWQIHAVASVGRFRCANQRRSAD